MTSGKSIKELLNIGIDLLNEAGIENSIFDARAFLCEILNKDQIFLDIHKNDIITLEAENTFLEYIQRRCKNEPYAYIVNKKEFMSLDFYVDKNVLIPRPDTEVLVEYIIDYCKNKNKHLDILDLCTGSGAIAVSIAHYVKNCLVTAVDISDDALEIATKNAISTHTDNKISFKKYDVLSDISPIGTFDIIVSNPPYIRKKDILTLNNNVKDYEPILALDGGEDGLIFYKSIIENADKVLKPDGMIAFEIGFDQSDDVSAILSKNNFKDINVLKDYSENDRVIVAFK